MFYSFGNVQMMYNFVEVSPTRRFVLETQM